MEPLESKRASTSPRQEHVIQYYDRLAHRYDSERFANSYGSYVDAQERRILQHWLAQARPGNILDLACGTGRLLGLATHGLDASEAMVATARSKHPGKTVYCGLGTELARFGVKFDAIFCMHLFMHLPTAEIEGLFRACCDQLRPGGMFIFDAPSRLRRKLTGFQATGWHAGTALSSEEVRSLAGAAWRHRSTRGVLFFPIHRLPPRIRPAFRPLDDLLGITPLKFFASYNVYCLEKKA